MDKLFNIQGVARSSLGIGVEEPLRCVVFGIIVFLAIILIWVGSSMVVSHMFSGLNSGPDSANSKSSSRVAYGHGGIVLLVGLTMVGAVHAAREGYIPTPGLNGY